MLPYKFIPRSLNWIFLSPVLVNRRTEGEWNKSGLVVNRIGNPSNHHVPSALLQCQCRIKGGFALPKESGVSGVAARIGSLKGLSLGYCLCTLFGCGYSARPSSSIHSNTDNAPTLSFFGERGENLTKAPKTRRDVPQWDLSTIRDSRLFLHCKRNGFHLKIGP